MPSLTVTLLGTGTSTGVPVIGCGCRVCTSDDPRDVRTRCSVHVEVETADGPLHLVVDTGPDFRQQALRERIPRVDAVLYTHAHFDHVVGADDLRPYQFETPAAIPCFASPSTAAVLRQMLGYLFADGSYPGVAHLDLREAVGPFVVQSRYDSAAEVTVTPIEALHGTQPVTGFRVGRFAYLTDVSAIPEASFPLLGDLDLLVLDALRHEPHDTHFTIGQAVEVARRIGARRTLFVHMTHTVLHRQETARLPPGVALAFDGQRVKVEG